MWKVAVLILAMGGHAAPAAGEVGVLIGFRDVWVTHVVRTAVNSAARRLDEPQCRRVLGDFVNQAGTPLDAVLEASGRNAATYVTPIRFVDGVNQPLCRRQSTLAFTAPGSRVVHVCGQLLAAAFLERPDDATIAMIHEILHVLGLAENPPTTSDITAQVARRCGR